jgi:putative ABC transport system permease protein
MRWIAALRERLDALVNRARQDDDLHEELRFHLDQETQFLREGGLDQRQARREAQIRLGGVERYTEEVRDARGVRLLQDLARDLALATRSLARKPFFSAGVALTFALGVGATTTIYTVVDGVMLRPLPYEEPSALVTVGAVAGGALVAPGVQPLEPISLLHYQHLRERARSFEMLAAVNTERLMPLSSRDGGREEVPAHEISSALLMLLGAATPALGRRFVPEEYGSRQEGAVMVTYEEWQSRYGADPGIIGRTIGRIRGGRFPAVVVGVLPRDFRPLEAFSATGEAPGYYFPAAPETLSEDRRWERWYVLGRLKPGFSLGQARAEVERVAGDVSREFAEAAGSRLPNGSRYRVGVNGLQAQTIGASGQVLALFLGAAGLLLVLATMNAATLLLARSLERTKEFAVRMALGAGRMQVIRLILSEAGVLVIAGAGLGVLFAYGGVAAFLRYAPASIPRLNAVAVDGRTLAVAAALSLGVGMAAGIFPAIRVARRGHGERLRAGYSFAEPTSQLRTVLVGGQMSLAIVLLAGAGLLFNSFVRIQALDPGFDGDRVLMMMAPYKDAASVAGLPHWRAWDRVLDELRSVPGVQRVAGTTAVPFQAPAATVRVQWRGDTPDSWRDGIALYAITPDYLRTIGTRLLAGRSVEPIDGPDTERVALVNESFARTHLDGSDPIKTFVRLSDTDGLLRVVGVVEDVVQKRAEDGFRPAIYVPYTQYRAAFVVAVIRTTSPTDAIVADVRAVAARLIPARPPDVRAVRELMASTHTSPRFQAMLIGSFALVATLLAAVGLYGTMTHFVERRRRELSIRIALGANRNGVMRMVVGRGMRLTMAGLTVGTMGTLFLTRTLTSLLYGVEPNDPATLLLVGVVLVVVSIAACVIPACRAISVDPVAVLRAE